MTDPIATPGGGAPVRQVPSLPLVAPQKKSGNASNLILVLAALVAVGGIAFAGGRATASASSGTGTGTNGGAGAFPRGSFTPGGSFDPAALGGGAGSRTITGTVKSVSGTTMTITTSTGTEQTIDISGTTYHAQAAATAAYVKTGATVSVSVTGFGGGARPGVSTAPDASAAAGASSV